MQTCSQTATAMILPGRAFNAISQTSKYEFGSPLPTVFFPHPRCPSSLPLSVPRTLPPCFSRTQSAGAAKLGTYLGCIPTLCWNETYLSNFLQHPCFHQKKSSRPGKLIYKSENQVCFLCRVVYLSSNRGTCLDHNRMTVKAVPLEWPANTTSSKSTQTCTRNKEILPKDTLTSF